MGVLGLFELLILATVIVLVIGGITALIVIIVRRSAAPASGLAVRARQLKAIAQFDQAVHLVASKTGMSLPDAAMFMQNLN